MNDYYRYKSAEFSGPEEIRGIQNDLLKAHLNYISRNSPYYKSMLSGEDISGIDVEHLGCLPFTDKSAFEKQENELLAVPMAKIVDIVLSSGTTGRPTKIMYTDNDLQRLAYNEEKSFSGCGITSDDTVLLTCTIDRCFVAGLAYFMGVRNLGAAAVRNGNNSFSSHMEIIDRLSPTVIVGVPSFLRKLGLFLRTSGIDPETTSVSRCVCIGEPVRSKDLSLLKMGKDLEEIWGAKVFSTYASSEIVTTFCECEAQNGGHLHPELAIAEIIDENGKVLPPGEEGEVVVTPLSVEGMPLLRFRTGDVSFLIDKPCRCGRRSVRLGPVTGRKKEMIKYKGTTLYPQAIYSALDEIPGINDYYVAVTSDYALSDDLKIYVSLEDSSWTTETIAEKLQSHLRVRPELIISSEEEIKKQVYSENSRKPRHFIRKGSH